jgi:hypothetical protein
MNSAGIDYLYVDSSDVPKVKKGEEFIYQLDIKSRVGNLKCRIDSGPAGMTVSPLGLVRWIVPADYQKTTESVTINLSDAVNQKYSHSFIIAIE